MPLSPEQQEHAISCLRQIIRAMSTAKAEDSTHGGLSALATACGIKPAAISQWIKKQVIPADRVPRLVELAQDHNLNINRHDLNPELWPAD